MKIYNGTTEKNTTQKPTKMNNTLKALIELRERKEATSFCVEQNTKEHELAIQLEREGVFELVRGKHLSTSRANFSYKLYRLI